MDISRDFEISELFFSLTDKHGKILGGNEVFFRISGYSKTELINKPHSTIRHQHMPRVIFRYLWNYIEAEKPIVAYVKNKAKDGCYYWVLALVNPIASGYLSVRLKPTSEIFNIIPALYQELKELELSIESKPDAHKNNAIEVSQALLVKRLNELGYADYDDFMRTALKNELDSRTALLKAITQTHLTQKNLEQNKLSQCCQDLRKIVEGIYLKRPFFNKLKELVLSTKTMSGRLPEIVKRAAINLAIQAEYYGDSARTISVLSSWLQEGCKLLGAEVDQVTTPVDSLIANLELAVFELECAYLQIDMIEYYIKEGNQPDLEPDPAFKAHVELLAQNTADTISNAWHKIIALLSIINGLSTDFDQLSKRVIGLGLIRVSGRVEASRLPESDKIASMFDGISTMINEAKGHLDELEEQIAATKSILIEVNNNKNDVNHCGQLLVECSTIV